MIWAIVRFSYEGWHRWKEAPEWCAFLRNEHRHMFHVGIWVEEKHNDRDLKFITFKRQMEDCIKSNILTFQDTDSCEIMAQKIKRLAETKCPKRKIKVSVFEDNENGAMVE